MKIWLQDNYKNWTVFLAIAMMLRFISVQVDSDFLNKFLTENLVLLLPALLAVNVTTMSILLTKIHDLKKEYPGISFKESIQAMKYSVWEQIVLILLAVVALILQESNRVAIFSSAEGQNIISVVLIMLAIASLQIVLDTANTLFDFLHTEDEISSA